MVHVKSFLAALGLVASSSLSAQVALAQSTPAQPSPPPPPTYKSLMDQGFELKTAVYLSDSASTRLAGSTVQPETVIVTLQKGPVTASCWIALADWQQQGIGAFPCNLLH